MAILRRVKEYNLKLKSYEMLFFLQRVNFLGHIVSENGIECDHVKMEKIKDLLPPMSMTGVRAILGLGNYYRHFIKGFSSIYETS